MYFFTSAIQDFISPRLSKITFQVQNKSRIERNLLEVFFEVSPVKDRMAMT